MTELQMIDVDTGDVLDTIRLVDDQIVTDGPTGREFFASKRSLAPESNDAELFGAYLDWSDGRIALHPVQQTTSHS